MGSSFSLLGVGIFSDSLFLFWGMSFLSHAQGPQTCT